MSEEEKAIEKLKDIPKITIKQKHGENIIVLGDDKDEWRRIYK